MRREPGEERSPGAVSRGFTLLEALVASALAAVLLVGVLQMFSHALQTDRGAAARTELTYRAQQVIENLRMLQLFAKAGHRAPAAAAGVATVPSGGAFSLGATAGPVAVPNDPAAANHAFWRAAGVVAGAGDPFRISYTVEELPLAAPAAPWAGELLLVTVTALPAGAPAAWGGAAPAAHRYLGGDASLLKRVDHVAYLVR
jgi:prepilin-type N-terminal cleavage/methylation domain-containing protein